MRKWRKTPGHFVYWSPTKLLSLSAQLGVRTGAWNPEVALDAGAGIDAGLPQVGGVSVRGEVRAVRSDPGKNQKALVRQLDQVVERLGGGELPDIDRGDEIVDGGWFRFHRRLRFGVGHADAMPEFKALILADESPMGEGLTVPGLLLNGSVAHLAEPYANEELRNSPGSRSGSSSDYLFIWLDDARRALEEDPEADIGKIPARYLGSQLRLRDPRTAAEMYRVFAEERPKDPPSFPRLLAVGPCEGVAQAFFVATTEEVTVVMGSPLYVRLCAFPPTPRRMGLRRFLSPT